MHRLEVPLRFRISQELFNLIFAVPARVWVKQGPTLEVEQSREWNPVMLYFLLIGLFSGLFASMAASTALPFILSNLANCAGMLRCTRFLLR